VYFEGKLEQSSFLRSVYTGFPGILLRNALVESIPISSSVTYSIIRYL